MVHIEPYPDVLPRTIARGSKRRRVAVDYSNVKCGALFPCWIPNMQDVDGDYCIAKESELEHDLPREGEGAKTKPEVTAIPTDTVDEEVQCDADIDGFDIGEGDRTPKKDSGREIEHDEDLDRSRQSVPTSQYSESAEEQDSSEIFDWQQPKHVFVLSSAGKPIFSLMGDEQRLPTLMGLIQGLMSLCGDCGDELESICAQNRRFVFLPRGDLILVAVSSWSRPQLEGNQEEYTRSEEEGDCETFLRLQLEYMYASIIFLLTSKVQAAFRKSPSFDLRELLGGADPSLKGILSLAEPSRGRGRMLGGGVETLWMDPDIRSRINSALQAVQSTTAPDALYAIWLCGEELVSLAQPRAPSHRLKSQDLLLLINFIATQPALRNAESWTPVCFPRFQHKGYLFAYIAFLEDPEPRTGTDTGTPPASWANGDERHRMNSSESSDPGKSGEKSQAGDSCLILVSTEASAEQFQSFRHSRETLETRFRAALGENWIRYLGDGARAERRGILVRFCLQMNALHFFYCLRVRQSGSPFISQVLTPPFAQGVAQDPSAQRRIWGQYVRAALRLRRGSSQEGRVRRRDDGRGLDNDTDELDGDEFHSEATTIFEAEPVHSLVYEVGATETVVSLYDHRDIGSTGGRWSSGSSGERDELHVCFPSSVTADVAYTAASRLAAIIRRDRDWLFLSHAGTLK